MSQDESDAKGQSNVQSQIVSDKMDRLQLYSLFSNKARAKQRLNISKGIKIDY